MLRIRFDVADLASVRFAYSPMQEAAFSLSAWLPGHANAHYAPWLREIAVDFDRVDLEFLLSLRGSRGWIPDFLTPLPLNSRPDIETELTAIRNTPADLLLHDLLGSHGPILGEPLATLARDPQALASRIADSFGQYWQSVMAPRWPRMSALLEADITYRSHRIATGGAAALFDSLDPSIRWENGTIHFDYPALDGDVRIAGRGLPMLPSIFPPGVTAVIDSEQSPILTYPARGRGALTHQPPPASDALAALLGRTRAALLVALDAPTSSTQLAHAHGFTPSAVNQHMSVLMASGLLARTRSGHSVLYLRSALGDRLVAGEDVAGS